MSGMMRWLVTDWVSECVYVSGYVVNLCRILTYFEDMTALRTALIRRHAASNENFKVTGTRHLSICI